MSNRFSPLIAIVMLVGVGTPQLAEARGRKSLSKKYFKRGENHYNAGEFRKAIGHYQRAFKAYNHPAFLFNIAQCHRQLKQYVKAVFFYRLFLSKRPMTSNRAEVARRIAEMQAKVTQAKLAAVQGRLSVVTDPEGAELRVDNLKGPPLETSPATLALKSGEHIVLIKKKGFLPLQRTVRIQVGKLTVVKVKLVPLDPRGAGAGIRNAGPIHHRWWFWTGIVTTLAAGALAGYLGSTAVSAHKDYLEYGTQTSRDKADRWALATDLTLAGGAAVAIATTVVAFIAHYRWKKARKEKSSLTLSPSCSASGCGVWVTGAF